MKKLLLIGTLALIIFAVSWYATHRHEDTPATSRDYSELIAPQPATATPTESKVSLTQMLQDGIQTQAGLLQSKMTNQENLVNYSIYLAGKELAVASVNPIELIKAFQLGHHQVLVLGSNQGGNQCSIRYQILSIGLDNYQLSQPFGSCLPLTSLEESQGALILKMPQNNPYLGPDVSVSYRYFNGKLEQIAATKPQQLKQKYANLTAAEILAIAKDDGCYIDGVLLDDNSCGNGRKYCLMFRASKSKLRDSNYKILKQFCEH